MGELPAQDARGSLCWICGKRRAVAADMTLDRSICASCRDGATRPYDEAWQTLSRYLRARWNEIVARGSFDLSQVFAKDLALHALRVHLYFVRALGCKLHDEGIDVELKPFATALLGVHAQPDVTAMVADSRAAPGTLVSYRPDVSVLRSGDEVQSALWVNLMHPVAIKVCYLKPGAPVRAPVGFPWHPARQRKIVKLSPYKGDTEPAVARRDLRI